MQQPSNPLLLKVGYFLLTLCTAIFAYLILTTERSDFLEGSEGGLFWVIYGINVVYFIAIVIYHYQENKFSRLLKGDERLYSIALIMYSISAHTLNYSEDLQIFAPYVDWMLVYLLLIHVAILAFPYRNYLPSLLQYVLYALNGAGLVMCIYLTIFLGPLNIIAFPASVILGISLLALAPFWFTVHFFHSAFRMNELPWSQRAYWAGVIVPVLILIGFLAKWNSIQQTIQTVRADYEANYTQEFPEWMILAQQLPDGPFTEMVITADAMTQRSFWAEGRGLFGQLSFSQFIRHNPLATIARIFHEELDISNETLIKVLEARYDARHMTHRRLWRGEDLSTPTVQTMIEAWPEFRLSYIEKTFTIKNHNRYDLNRQEAVYTFYLPEGSAVSSLSLWVEGEERKSRLTTRSKADSAYVTIVGVEARDPALVHWQEGNRITVTVFPCTPKEDRKFKIGFTAPMKVRDSKLEIHNVFFDGPEPENAKEEILYVNAGGHQLKPSLDWGFRPQDDGTYVYRGVYHPDWVIRLPIPELSTQPFSFNGKSYQIRPLQHTQEPFSPKVIVLDINRSWSSREFENIWNLVKDYEVYAWDHQSYSLTEENHSAIFDQLRQRHFSLVPLHKLPAIQETLVISKSNGISPILDDLQNSGYARGLQTFLLAEEEKMKWFDIGDELSPFVQTLNQLRVIDYYQGSAEELGEWLEAGHFQILEEMPDRANIPSAGIAVDMHQTESETASQVPDHLARLYHYNDLLRSIGNHYFDRDHLEETWLRQAEEAYIVSPVSSLIVLETQADYERFGIDENENTLGNAKFGEDGAVPEPHEWMLIVLAAIILLWQVYRRRI